ncbi:MAG: biopolymer transporter ExbD [Myxococcota bacterium]|jgi:biopolymer transport protein ExbD|nr:biopolymer transporter ExbD [Myxococcota bacterium]
MNFQANRARRGAAVIELTPLVDIIFQLLLFFLITATYTKNPTLDINLPKAGSKSMGTHDKDIMLDVRRDGEVSYENQNLSMDALEGLLTAQYASNQDAVVVIRADQASQHGRVVELMDLAKKVGFTRLAIATRAAGSVEP